MQYLLVHSLNSLHLDTVTLFLIGLQKDSPLKLTAVVHNGYTLLQTCHIGHTLETHCVLECHHTMLMEKEIFTCRFNWS